MMREWLGVLPETKIYHDDTSLPKNVRHWCSSKDIFLLERSISPAGSSSSTPSPVDSSAMTTAQPIVTATV